MSGVLALVGGCEWTVGCDFDRDLLAAADTDQVLVVPTAAAYEHPERAVMTAERWFSELGATVRCLMVLRRPDALEPANLETVRDARFVYLSGGSAMHLRSVLVRSPLWDALVEAWQNGAVIAGSSAGAIVLCDPMVDPRGGAFTVGLGLVRNLAVVPHHDTGSVDKERRTLHLAPSGLPVAGIDERTALIRGRDGTWETSGAGKVSVFVDGLPATRAALP